MIIVVEWELGLGNKHDKLHDKVAKELKLPLEIDLTELFDDPGNTGIFEIEETINKKYDCQLKDFYVK